MTGGALLAKIRPRCTPHAGNGTEGLPFSLFSGDGGPAVQAELSVPGPLAFGPDGSLYIADVNNFRVRRVSPAGVITTVAGNGKGGYSGDGGLATQAPLDVIGGLAVAPDGALYISESGQNVVRRVGVDGIICTVAGVAIPPTPGSGYEGDGGVPYQAGLNFPNGLALGLDGSLYIADTGNHVVRRVATPIRCASMTLATVPNVVGQTQAAATAAIIAAGLAVGSVTSQQSTTAPAGSVISQAPAAGTQVAFGSTVDLVLSSGSTVLVPNVVGQTQAAANAAITAATLTDDDKDHGKDKDDQNGTRDPKRK